MSEEKLYKDLSNIQQSLKAPKGQFNNFGKYKYRSCEDILEAVKPLLAGLVLTLSDEIIQVDTRFYIKSTAKISNSIASITVSAFARESLDKKGMDDSQITGTASSYARKYALNGLFLIDDTKDADTDEHTNQTNKPEGRAKTTQVKPEVKPEVKSEVAPVDTPEPARRRARVSADAPKPSTDVKKDNSSW